MKINQAYEIIRHKENQTQSFIQNFQGEEIYLYGAGKIMAYVIRFFAGKIKIKAIVDTFKTGKYEGIPIIPLSDVLKSEPKNSPVFFISVSEGEEEIRKELEKYYSPSQIYHSEVALYDAFHLNISEYQDYVLKNQMGFEKLSSDLEDELSKETLSSVLLGRTTGNSEYFKKVKVPHQYYVPEIITFQDQEVMVELGSNDGETLKEFLALCPNYSCIYCFEPEVACIPPLEGLQKSNKNVYLIKKGAWSSTQVLTFCSDAGANGSSHISEDFQSGQNVYQIEVAAVDDVVKEKITYMKMDVEGAELEALKGAQKQIQENKPKLAVSVYHKPEDLLQIPRYLKSLVPEYKFYLRHHTNTGFDTVLYAVI